MHTAILGTDPPDKPQPSNFFCQAEKQVSSGRQSLDNSNMLQILKNNTYTDYRTAYKHVLIPSYVIRVIY